MTASLPAPVRAFFQRRDVLGALLVGSMAMLLSLARTLHEPALSTDLDPLYHAARALLHGKNPYEAVGPANDFRWGWLLNYPLPTVMLVMPFSGLALPVARVCFSTVGGGLLGYAIGRDHFRRLGLVLSAAFLIAISRNQWSPYITAAWFLPLAGIFLAAKPNIAFSILAGARSWRQLRWIVGAGLVLLVVSLIARPTWPLDWLRILQQMKHVQAPIMRPWGFLCALALLKWRRADARLFLALVCVPQTPSLYDLLPLFIVTRNVREVSLLSLLTNALFLTIVVLGPFHDFNGYAYELANVSTFIVYLPVLVLLLLRPNVFHDQPTVDETPAPTALRVRLESMARVDVALVMVNLAAASLLIWLTLVTRHA